ncbi:hypothetical protein [Hymenobacter baengnokdamensis]|uniref:hypothetical protein n=1 Tax=Hymenobacter baengnokdamensis TaxID=2615203 RepID=UPI0012470264|nr:hypothetical protein [Hymenobacter baengnokdamensis]
MVTIILAGWRSGLRKVALTRLQQELLHLSLKEAKNNTDRLLESPENTLQTASPITLSVPDKAAAEFISRANSLGALVGFVLPDRASPASSSEATAIQQAA